MGMSMSTNAGAGKAGPDVMVDMNMTPLIDVMLVMIIMMIITIPIQNHSVNLNLPIAPPQIIEHPKVMELAIDFDGTLYWNGAQIDRASLDARLAEVGAMSRADQPEVHIRPNRLVDYKTVAAVLAMAQRHDVVRMGLTGNDQFL